MDQVKLLAGERQKGESYRAIQACNDYLRMGPRRSLRLLLDEYSKGEQNIAPTRALGTLMGWSQRYTWPERAASYDVELERRKNERAAAIMQEGLALTHNRVDKLKSLAGLLWDEMHERDEDGVLCNIWVPDVKQIGRGDYAERIDLERFNSAIIREYRDTLDDIAKETGGRVQKQELTGKDGGPIIMSQADAVAALQAAQKAMAGKADEQ